MARAEPLLARVLTAAVALPAVVGLTLAGGWPLAALVLAVAAAGGLELTSVLARQGLAAPVPLALAAALAPPAAAALAGLPAAVAAAAAAGPVAAATWVLRAARASNPPRAAAWAAQAGLAAAWLGLPLALWLELRATRGALGALYPLAAVWAADTAAYFAGLRWGRRRLAPAVSPGKSVEGAVAGASAAAVLGAALAPWWGVDAGGGALVGLLLGVVGQVGDLWESGLKRGAALKDTGRAFPGHGGVLDRVDSMLLAVPAAYLIHAWLARGG